MEYLLVALASAAAACLTLFSGFGLGTVLLPVFAIFFAIEQAVALTAIVHLLNNLLKLLLLGRHTERTTLLRFGVPALIAAFAGAYLLVWLSVLEPLATYSLGHIECQVTPVKITVALLLIGFALFEALPSLRAISFERQYVPLGGLLSGFFGGLSGHQGALRSAFLLRCGLTKEQFLGTGIAIACLVDVARISVYGGEFLLKDLGHEGGLVLTAIGAAFAGTFLGNRLIPKMTFGAIRIIVAVMLFGIAVGLGAGIL